MTGALILHELNRATFFGFVKHSRHVSRNYFVNFIIGQPIHALPETDVLLTPLNRLACWDLIH